MEPNFTFNMLWGLLAAALISRIAIPPVVRVARKKQLVALPNGRTSHNGAVPALGGVAIFAAVSIATSLFLENGIPREFQFTFPALLMIFMIGMKDDLVNLTAHTRLIAQILAGLLIVVFADIRVASFYGIFGLWELSYPVSLIFSLIVFVGLVNAFNLIDGIDGLASGLGIQISLVFGIWLAMIGHTNYATLAFALTGALIPFYIFNVFGKKYKLFMGDTGSLLLGTIFATLSIKILCCPLADGHILQMTALPAVVIASMIIPIADTLKVFTIRISKGQSPFYADRNHLHHDLIRMGLTHWQASTLIILANFMIFLFAMAFRNIHPLMLCVMVAFLGAVAVMVPRFFYPVSEQKRPKRPSKVAYAK